MSPREDTNTRQHRRKIYVGDDSNENLACTPKTRGN